MTKVKKPNKSRKMLIGALFITGAALSLEGYLINSEPPYLRVIGGLLMIATFISIFGRVDTDK